SLLSRVLVGQVLTAGCSVDFFPLAITPRLNDQLPQTALNLKRWRVSAGQSNDDQHVRCARTRALEAAAAAAAVATLRASAPSRSNPFLSRLRGERRSGSPGQHRHRR